MKRAFATRLLLAALLATAMAAATAAFAAPVARDSRSGVFAIWIGTRNELRDFAFITGGQAAVQWRDVEPTEGHYDFSKLNGLLQPLAAKGLATTVQLDGGNKPGWLFAACPYNPAKLHTQVGDSTGTLMYWHPRHKQAYLNLLAAYANYVRTSPYRSSILGARMNYDAIGTEIVDVPSGYRKLSQGWVVPTCVDPGQWPWTSAIGDDYTSAALRGFVQNFTPDILVFCRVTYASDVLALYSDRIESGQLAWFNTGSELEPPTSQRVSWYQVFFDYCRSGKTYGYSESYADAWGYHGGNQDTHWCSPPQMLYWRLLSNLHCGISFPAVYGDDLNIALNAYYPTDRPTQPYPTGDVPQYKNEFYDALAFAGHYAGYHTNPQQSPGAWIAFRQGSYFTGDYTFLMSRLADNTAYTPAQKTVGPDNARFGAFARYLRSGNTMNLVLDQTFVNSLKGQKAGVRVTYLDNGKGSFTVHAGGASFGSRLQDSRQWKVTSCTIEGASLTTNSLGAHISIDASISSITLHMVEVARKTAPLVFPTTFTRALFWVSSNTLQLANSGYNANNHGVWGDCWTYDDTTSGGALASPYPWYSQTTTPILWDSANLYWYGSTTNYPQIDSVSVIHNASSAANQSKIARALWTAPASGVLTVGGNVRLTFLKETAAKTTEWVIAKRSGATYTVLAFGTASVAAGEAGSQAVTRTVNLTQAAFPLLTGIPMAEGDALVWTHRITAIAGTKSVKMVDDRMTLGFVPARQPIPVVPKSSQWRLY